MHFGVLGNPGSWYVSDLQRAANHTGHRLDRLDFHQLASMVTADGTEVTAADCRLDRIDGLIVRTMPPGSLEQVVYRMDVLGRLESAGVDVLNPARSIECAVDKFLTTARLAAVGLPVPETVVCEDAESALAAFENLGGDIVVKPLFGAEGRGIVRVSDPDLALRTFRTLERIDSVLYIQRCVSHPGYDIRVLILDGRVVGGMRRVATDSFRTNVSQSGRAEPYELSDHEQQLALRAAEATGARFAGVDLLNDENGRPLVIEVNAVPGWRAFAKVTRTDVARLVIDSLHKRQD